MAIGGIGAWILYSKNTLILDKIFTPLTQIATVSTIIIFILLGIEIPIVNHEFYSILFIITILNFAANPKCLANLENSVLDYLGKISYSIYMWHGIAIMFGLHTARYFNPLLNDAVSNIIYYIVTFIATFILSYISYEYFEMQFLKFKHLFTKVKSGNLVKEKQSLSKIENVEKMIENGKWVTPSNDIYTPQ